MKISPPQLKLSTAQQRVLLFLLDQGATEVQWLNMPSNKRRTIACLERLGLVAPEVSQPTNPHYKSIHFTPAGMSIARELRRMRFQEPKPFAVRT